MENTATTSYTAELAEQIYKNMKMGADSVINLLPKVEDGKLKTHMTGLLDSYEKYAADAKKVLDSEGKEAKEENIMTKMGAKMGMSMKTMVDSTTSHIAELLMEGAVMGICEMSRLVKRYENTDCNSGLVERAREIVKFEEKNLEKAKAYL